LLSEQTSLTRLFEGFAAVIEEDDEVIDVIDEFNKVIHRDSFNENGYNINYNININLIYEATINFMSRKALPNLENYKEYIKKLDSKKNLL